MNGADESIRALLADDVKRIIARFCREPHPSSEIIKHVVSGGRVDDRSYYERIVADGLKDMEKMGAISYGPSGWETTEATVNVLKKYFGD